MCFFCGCGNPHSHTHIDDKGNVVTHAHGHGDHDHSHGHAHTRTVTVEQDILARNNAIADENRALFAAKKILALNFVSSPGSGKTEVIIRRTRKLIQNYQVAPSSILVVTFTKAAAGQMRERFLHLCGVKKSQVTFGTFHGIFYGILRQAYGITSANIAGEEIKYQILRQILQNSSLQMEDENDLLESLAREISTVKHGLIPLSHYYSASCPDEQFRKIYETYEKRLHGKRLLDFDDLLVYCYQLFQKHPDILQAWQK